MESCNNGNRVVSPVACQVKELIFAQSASLVCPSAADPRLAKHVKAAPAAQQYAKLFMQIPYYFFDKDVYKNCLSVF
jgi:hypothetical protein